MLLSWQLAPKTDLRAGSWKMDTALEPHLAGNSFRTQNSNFVYTCSNHYTIINAELFLFLFVPPLL